MARKKRDIEQLRAQLRAELHKRRAYWRKRGHEREFMRLACEVINGLVAMTSNMKGDDFKKAFKAALDRKKPAPWNHN